MVIVITIIGVLFWAFLNRIKETYVSENQTIKLLKSHNNKLSISDRVYLELVPVKKIYLLNIYINGDFFDTVCISENKFKVLRFDGPWNLKIRKIIKRKCREQLLKERWEDVEKKEETKYKLEQFNEAVDYDIFKIVGQENKTKKTLT